MQRRIVLAIVAVVCAVIGTLAFPLLADEGQRITVAADNDLRSDADAIASRVRRLKDLSRVSSNELLVASAPEIQAAIYDTSGVRLAGQGPADGGAPVREASNGDPSSSTVDGFRVRTEPIVRAGSIVAVLRVGDPLAEINTAILRRRLTLLATAATAVAAAALLAVLLSRRLLRPIEPMIETARRLRDGDFSARTTPTGLGELDALGVALNEAAGRIEALVERERAFSADVAHQLRTPITAIKTAIETEQIDPRDDPFLVLDDLLGDVERLESTVGGLLALRRDAPKDREPLPVGAILDDLDAQYRPLLARTDRRLVIDISADLPTVRASRSAVEQILSIVVSNSVTHGAGRVTVAAHPDRAERTGQPALAITVTDEGPGIGDDIERVFRRRVSDGHGNGIGLSLAGSLAYAEGASLSVDAPGPNPTFRLVLPATSTTPTQTPEPPLRADRSGNTWPTPNRSTSPVTDHP